MSASELDGRLMRAISIGDCPGRASRRRRRRIRRRRINARLLVIAAGKNAATGYISRYAWPARARSYCNRYPVAVFPYFMSPSRILKAITALARIASLSARRVAYRQLCRIATKRKSAKAKMAYKNNSKFFPSDQKRAANTAGDYAPRAKWESDHEFVWYPQNTIAH